MRALLAAVLLFAAPALAALPTVGDGNGDGVPDTLDANVPRQQACAGDAVCIEAAASLAARPGEDGAAQLTAHQGLAAVRAGDCALACAGLAAGSFYEQPQGWSPDITLHGIPNAGATGALRAEALGAALDAPFEATDTDHNNRTWLGAALRPAGLPVEGQASVVGAALVLLHHDRGFPHTRLVFVDPAAELCAPGQACAALDLDQSYFHHDSDDDVIHEQHRVGTLDHVEVACALAGCGAFATVAAEGGFLLEDSFFVIEPPSGVSGDASASLQGRLPIFALPDAAWVGGVSFAVRDPDRDLSVDEAFLDVCAQGSCTRLG